MRAGGLIYFAAGLMLCACIHETVVSRPPIAVVQNILSGSEAALSCVLSSYDASSPTGDISIVDSPERAAMLTQALMEADEFDNIDASVRADELPDFAGERIVSLMDISHEGYAQLDTLTLRDLAVRAVVAALDTRCCVASFDTEYRSTKPTSKVVIVSSPELQSVAAYDIDTLLRATKVKLPVLFPVRQMISDAYASGARNIGVIADGLSSVSGAYDNICEELAPSDVEHSCFVMSSDDIISTDVLSDFLQSYKDAGNTAPLDVLVVDSFYYDEDALRAQYASILLEDIQENVEIRSLVSKDFNFVTLARTVTEGCFRIMRQRNLFTHDIHYPQAGAYLTNPEMFQYALMQFDWNALPSGLESDLMNAAPKTYSAYVQDLHISGGN